MRQKKIDLSNVISILYALVRPNTKTSYDPDIHFLQGADCLYVTLSDKNPTISFQARLPKVGNNEFDFFISLETAKKHIKPNIRSIEVDNTINIFYSAKNKNSINGLRGEKVSIGLPKVFETITINTGHLSKVLSKISTAIDKNYQPIIIGNDNKVSLMVTKSVGNYANYGMARMIVYADLGMSTANPKYIPHSSQFVNAIINTAAQFSVEKFNLCYNEDISFVKILDSDKYGIIISAANQQYDEDRINEQCNMGQTIYTASQSPDFVLMKLAINDATTWIQAINDIQIANDSKSVFDSFVLNIEEQTISNSNISNGESILREVTYELTKLQEIEFESVSMDQDITMIISKDKPITINFCQYEEEQLNWIYLSQDSVSLFTYYEVLK